jgi:hypothetical protein
LLGSFATPKGNLDRDGFYSGEIGHQFQMKSAIESGGNKAS